MSKWEERLEHAKRVIAARHSQFLAAQRLRDRGCDYAQIAQQLGLSETSVRLILRSETKT